MDAEEYARHVVKATFDEQRKLNEDSLRDQFAMAALSSAINTEGKRCSSIAKRAYHIADAMMEAR